MAETVIELDLSSPWEPPEPPEPRLRARWVAVAALLAVTLGVLVSGGPRPDTGLLYVLDQQIMRADTAGGRIFLARYQPTGPGPLIEALRLSDGRSLWQRSADVNQQLVVAGPDLVLLLSEARTGQGDASQVVALDSATGRELWTRSPLRLVGAAPGVLVVQDTSGEADRVVADGRDLSFDPSTNHAGPQTDQRYLGLSARTGAQLWDLTVPAGSDVNFSWEGGLYRINRFDVLSGTGLLTRRDARTGAVTGSHQLDWSGLSATFSAGWLDGSGRPADRVVVYPDREQGAAVFDLASGRLLFRWPGDQNSMLFRCADRFFCAGDDDGVVAVDSTTGARRWRVGLYNGVSGFAGDRLLVGTRYEPVTLERTALVDSGTGRIVKELADWQPLTSGSRRLLVWRPVDLRTSLLGELDPVTGVVTVLARAEDWYGTPQCSVDGRALVCVVVGGLSVWRLPHGL